MPLITVADACCLPWPPPCTETLASTHVSKDVTPDASCLWPQHIQLISDTGTSRGGTGLTTTCVTHCYPRLTGPQITRISLHYSDALEKPGLLWLWRAEGMWWGRVNGAVPNTITPGRTSAMGLKLHLLLGQAPMGIGCLCCPRVGTGLKVTM